MDTNLEFLAFYHYYCHYFSIIDISKITIISNFYISDKTENTDTIKFSKNTKPFNMKYSFLSGYYVFIIIFTLAVVMFLYSISLSTPWSFDCLEYLIDVGTFSFSKLCI